MTSDTSGAVVLSWLFPQDVDGFFAKSLVDLTLYDLTQGGHHLDPTKGGGFIALSSGPRIAEARNTVVDHFANHFPAAEWLLMLDSDMVFQADLLDRLLDCADPVEAPIVGGLCFAGGRTADPYPTIYRAVNKVAPDGREYANIAQVHDYPRDAMVKVAATGGACLLMHRAALATMQNRYGTDGNGVPQPYPWFAEGVVGPEGEMWGEDTVFGLRATSLNIPVWVNTAIKLGHRKRHTLDETYFDNRRKARELSDQGLFDDLPSSSGVGSPESAGARGAARARLRAQDPGAIGSADGAGQEGPGLSGAVDDKTGNGSGVLTGAEDDSEVWAEGHQATVSAHSNRRADPEAPLNRAQRRAKAREKVS